MFHHGFTSCVFSFQSEDSSNMDGFYDQQVPYVLPESVSVNESHTCQFVACVWVFFNNMFLLQEAENSVSDRKRKSVDTELDQDIEGTGTRDHVVHIRLQFLTPSPQYTTSVFQNFSRI